MFDDIRPFRDDEAAVVIKKLVNEPALHSSIASYVLPKLYSALPKTTQWLVKHYLKFRMNKIQCVGEFQQEIAKYLHHLIKKSTDGFTYHGLESLDMSKPTLFISNHRDIALDPALVNLALYKNGIDTVEIAIGDNLLSKPWVSDLMRINKSFIVKRSEKTKRAMLMASKNLSSYIHHTLNDNNTNVWIAQREGRAKDGLDKTNAALISMLLLNKGKDTSIEQYLTELNIVPVSISYEYDPCDSDKAIELATIEATGSYQKAEGEDLKSITQGLIGHKGRVHIEFGQPVLGDYQDSKAIAAEIDRQIINNYRLYDSNLAAKQQLESEVQDASMLHTLTQRMQHLTNEQQRWLLTMYANPALAKDKLEN
ncbi:1-acyl-sn-glycerol-3-phosphate acyltransferase [Psychrobium sp. 1_MG-2023]|uniref:1-acyl-sn-glycerol-3-phosphate acyltransferase n=1 Tax=Psychrobium sp. 1_MG-2023 TaxID=3062624 RepID=UPI000C3238D4|nr:1-acyl-sn-glycerol-3-phosphate acyltransferase [Psychrobium sp. 1_MG-2023]MDP2561353.1 1-acyl-sn-glycerol-3-phosphate acyltransferase [Psychrobium sp. 1_MG-2023]PKF54166.1 cytochrome C oxidase Cbb3 [Alteromonadales bacterium alter-6D02]